MAEQRTRKQNSALRPDIILAGKQDLLAIAIYLSPLCLRRSAGLTEPGNSGDRELKRRGSAEK